MMEEQYIEELSRLSHCPKCGKESVPTCLNCESTILGTNRPAYCGVCGKPFPWTETTLATAREFADELESLSEGDKTALKATFDDLTIDTPRTELAAHRFKKFLAKIAPTAGDALKNIIVTVATEAAKKGMGLK